MTNMAGPETVEPERRKPMVGSPMKPDSMEPGAPNPEDMKRQLVGMLKQVKQVAEKNGIDWSEVVSEVEGNKTGASATLPRPPKPDMGMSSMGGM
jgi:hypothetical protein